ncbi:hypothetical protein [Myxosarcina sp. GI1]|uniref:hypothetical protein n=1 Tax=Myxosarcina sp. GI1 TaxID=1541065 RepID=UPI00055CF0FF|nr:hypothetical protein [Myxosarcina sp. GI1]
MRSFFKKSRQLIATVLIVLVFTTVTACASAPTAQNTERLAPGANGQVYSQLERGNSTAGQQFGDWVVSKSQGLIKDAYVRDNNKLGVVITPQVRPDEVKSLARSLTQGFHKNFPDRNLSVLVYAPDKELILTTQYDLQTNQVQYKS